MSNEPKLDHDYDGIREYDNPLPRWWVWMFYLSILFAGGYWVYYHLMDGPGLVTIFERDRREAENLALSQKPKESGPTGEVLAKAVLEPGRRQLGSTIYVSKCASCHGEKGEGGIGPNLTDDYWIHGAKLEQQMKVIAEGINDKGMPPWGAVLSSDEIVSVVATVQGMHGTKPPNAKAPQGVLVKE